MNTVREHLHHGRPRPGRLRRLRLAFVTVNALGFAVVAGLTAFRGPLVATPLHGPFTLGMALLVLEGLLLFWTAARYDRGCGNLESGPHR